MIQAMRTMLVIAMLALTGAPEQHRPAAAAPIFRFDTGGLWLNLHHFLYVLGRAEAKTPDASRAAVAGAPAEAARAAERMTPEERARWAAAGPWPQTSPTIAMLVLFGPLVSR